MTLTIDPLICTNKTCGKALAGWVPFCPYCGTAQPKSVLPKPVEANTVERMPATPDAVSTATPVGNRPDAAVVPDSPFADSAGVVAKPSPFSVSGSDIGADGKPGQGASPFEIKGAPEIADSPFEETPKPEKDEQKQNDDPSPSDQERVDEQKVSPQDDKPCVPPDVPGQDIDVGGNQPERGGKPKAGKSKFLWLLMLAVLGIGGYLFFGGGDANDKLVAQAQVAYDRGDFASADKILVEVLRKKPDHPGARKLNGDIQAKHTLHRKLLAEARGYLQRNRYSEARRSADMVLSENPNNTEAQDIKRRAESGMQAIIARCDAAAQSGVDLVASGNLDMARRKLQEARASGADCDGVQRLSQEITGAEQRMAAVVRPAPASPEFAPPQPAAPDNSAILRRQLAEARQQLEAGNHTTALKIAQNAKEMATSNGIRTEADQIIAAANKMKVEQASRKDIFR